MSWCKTKILLLITCLLSIAIIVSKEYVIVKSNTYSNTNLKKQTQSNVVFDFEAYCETIEDEVQDQDQDQETETRRTRSSRSQYWRAPRAKIRNAQASPGGQSPFVPFVIFVFKPSQPQHTITSG